MKNYFKNKKLKSLKKKINRFKVPAKITFLISGILATIWFLIRVVPKPSRATYPCVRAATPIMSGFILYLISLPTSLFLFRKARKKLKESKYWIAIICFIGFIGLSITYIINDNFKNTSKAELVSPDYFVANAPIGTPQGIIPGRVVWVYDADATNENMFTSGSYWYEDENADQEVIETMLADGIKELTEQETVYLAWDQLFKYFNNKHGKGKIGYAEGEKFFIKINLTNSCCGVPGSENRMDATPQVVLALLKQLIDTIGVEQSDIWLGDPYRTFRDEYYDKCHPVYPDVNYCDGEGGGGVIATEDSDNEVLFFSDGEFAETLPQAYLDAAYFINLPCLKTHDVAGITLTAKNHQGSIGPSAFHMHYSLPGENPGEGEYRHLVDYMGHKDMGGKTILNIVDGIWAGFNWEGHIEKWEMTPFNGDFPSSLFLSQDQVAIDAVCFDFLLEEYKDRSSNKYPYMSGTDDYLYQAASSEYWPTGIEYDPEDDGTPIGSLGVYEHWNNATDKQYSKNI
ncbi:MAG: DUF362 domain-containing protein, partial [Bacteroidales bacterium]|nr:DUF362 domain-containing protein [Bacteroidales bacterium]